MLKRIVTCKYTPAEAEKRFKGTLLRYADVVRDKYRMFSGEAVECRLEDGTFVALYVPGVFNEAEQADRLEVFTHLPNDLRNRPEVYGNGARQQLRNKDGSMSSQVGTPSEILEQFPGKSVLYGAYRSKNKDGKPVCGLTGAVLTRPDLYHRVHAMAVTVTEWYEALLPGEFARQMLYVDALGAAWKIPNTAFTTVYGISRPTAVHTDDFDIPTATGVITTAGNFAGNEFCLPEFQIGFDVQPGDLLFVDVHRWHGNLPKTYGHRIGQVYFVRKGMHECGQENGAFSIDAAGIAAAKAVR